MTTEAESHHFRVHYKDLKLNRVVSQAKPRSGSWIEVVSESESYLNNISAKLGLDPLVVIDSLDLHEIPRIEDEPEALYIFTRVPSAPQGLTATRTLLLAISPRFLVSVSTQPVATIQEVLAQDDVNTTQRTKLVIQLFHALTRAYQKEVHQYSRQIGRLGNQISDISPRDINELVKYQMVFEDYLSALEPTNVILKQLLSGKYLRLFEVDKELVEDLFIATSQLIEMCEARVKRIASIRAAYETIASNALNRTMKRLTAVTVILTLPTMIFSFYGMNVNLPFDEEPIFWLGLVFATAAIVYALSLVFRKKDLL